MQKHQKCDKLVGKLLLFHSYCILFMDLMNYFFKEVNESESGSEEEDGARGVDTLDDDGIEFNVPFQQKRHITPKKNWITPRLCAALDDAKVKRMRLKK